MQAKFWVQKELGPKKFLLNLCFLGQEIIKSKKNLVQKSLDPIMGQQSFGFTKFWLLKKFWVETFLDFVSKNICRSKKDWVKQNFGSKRNVGTKYFWLKEIGPRNTALTSWG